MLQNYDVVIFNLEVPSTKQVISLRQMTVKDEKILLIAKASTEETRQADILGAIRQVVANCVMNKDVDIDKLAMFDIDYIFLKLWGQSVSNVVRLSYKDGTDGENGPTYNFEVSLDDVEVKFLDNPPVITPDTGPSITMKFPSAVLYKNKDFLAAKADKVMELLLQSSIAKVGDDAITDTSSEMFSTWLENLPLKTYHKLQTFLGQLPTLFYEIKYKNQKGEDRKIVLQSLSDFFTL